MPPEEASGAAPTGGKGLAAAPTLLGTPHPHRPVKALTCLKPGRAHVVHHRGLFEAPSGEEIAQTRDFSFPTSRGEPLLLGRFSPDAGMPW